MGPLFHRLILVVACSLGWLSALLADTHPKRDGKGSLPFPPGNKIKGAVATRSLLPAEGEAFQYRIKNVKEPHERVAKEYDFVVRDLLRQR